MKIKISVADSHKVKAWLTEGGYPFLCRDDNLDVFDGHVDYIEPYTECTDPRFEIIESFHDVIQLIKNKFVDLKMEIL